MCIRDRFGASASAVNNNNETQLQMAIKKGNRKEIERVLMNENKVIWFVQLQQPWTKVSGHLKSPKYIDNLLKVQKAERE